MVCFVFEMSMLYSVKDGQIRVISSFLWHTFFLTSWKSMTVNVTEIPKSPKVTIMLHGKVTKQHIFMLKITSRADAKGKSDESCIKIVLHRNNAILLLQLRPFCPLLNHNNLLKFLQLYRRKGYISRLISHLISLVISCLSIHHIH